MTFMLIVFYLGLFLFFVLLGLYGIAAFAASALALAWRKF